MGFSQNSCNQPNGKQIWAKAPYFSITHPRPKGRGYVYCTRRSIEEKKYSPQLIEMLPNFYLKSCSLFNISWKL